jgi:hypothetical protein
MSSMDTHDRSGPSADQQALLDMLNGKPDRRLRCTEQTKNFRSVEQNVWEPFPCNNVLASDGSCFNMAAHLTPAELDELDDYAGSEHSMTLIDNTGMAAPTMTPDQQALFNRLSGGPDTLPSGTPLTARQQLLTWLQGPVATPVPVRESPLPGQELQIVKFEKDYGEEYETRTATTSLESATSISSRVMGGAASPMTEMHKPVLDIDMPVKAIESSTPGHYHLYIDKELSWEDYELLLRTLAAVGIIEPGYLDASVMRQHTSVRLPWVRKDAATLANESVKTF